MKKEKAIFAAGCFWGVQSLFDSVPGVISTRAGYTGGQTKAPDYRSVCSDTTGHAEGVEVEFDADKVSYDSLLDLFFAAHDPTTLNKQGPDVGTQYRSAVFYFDEGQKKAALKKIAELTKARVFKNPIVTEVVKADVFYPAEEYHQKYFQKTGKEHSCSVVFPQVVLSEADLRARLTPDQYAVLRQKHTEPPFTGKYLNHTADGTYVCAACGNPIFAARDQFNAGCGWPSFDKALPGSIRLKPDLTYNMVRTEVVCARCGSHLGHLFNDGPTPTGERFCVNSVSMDFEKK